MPLTDSPSFDSYKDGDMLPDEPPEQTIRPTWLLIAGLLLAAGVLGALVFFQNYSPAGVVTGQIIDQNNQPVAAEVFILGSPNTIMAGSTGRFELDPVPAGEQTIVVGYQGVGDAYPVLVEEGGRLDLGTLKIDTSGRVEG